MPGGRQILREEVRNDRGKICRKQFSLGGGCLRTREKWSFSQCQTIVKMISSEQARRDEDVGVEFTSIRGTGKNIRALKTQGLIYKNASTNRSLAVSNGRAFSDIRLRSGETASRLGVFTYPRGEDWVKGQRRGRAPVPLTGGVTGPAWPGQRLLLAAPSPSRQRPSGTSRQSSEPATGGTGGPGDARGSSATPCRAYWWPRGRVGRPTAPTP